MARLAHCETVDPSEYYFRVAPVFETGVDRYAWLNKILAVGEGERLTPNVVGAGTKARYCRPRVLPVNPARRKASAIASRLAGPELLRPAGVSVGRGRLSDPVVPISVVAVFGRASGV